MFKVMMLIIVYFVSFILSVIMSRGRHGLVEYAIAAGTVTFIAWCFMSLIPTDL